VADDRALGLAFAEVNDPRARELLLRARPADAEVLLRLAPTEKDPQRAGSLYTSLLRDEPGNTTALVNLGALYAQSGRTADAIRLWERALESNPAIEAAALNLSQVAPAAQGRAVLERYLEFNPGSTAVRARLDTLRRQAK
jgi:cytochrome c-type biogenesis protein CcmH/NrfG